MKARFQLIEGGRYNSFATSRLHSHTYGENKVAEPIQIQSDAEEDSEYHGTYGELLFDKRWREKRMEILMRDNHECAVCNATQNLQVHHRQYHMVKATKKFKPPWEYTNSLLVTLCENCHSRGHNKYKVPVIQV